MNPDNHELPQPDEKGNAPSHAIVRRTARILLPSIAIVLLMLWVLGVFRRGRIEPASLPPPVEAAAQVATAAVEAQWLPAEQEATGTVRPERVFTVSSRVTANIQEIRAAAGRRVAAGEILAVLDNRDLRKRIEQAQEAVRGAEAALAQARSDFERDRRLFEQQVIPAYDFEHVRTNLRLAETNLERLKRIAEEAEVSLSYAVIRSPAAGVIVDRLAEPGDLAAPGRPLLSMYDENRLWLEASVPENLLAQFRPGQPRVVYIDAVGRDVPGRIAEIVPSADPLSRSVAVRVRLERSAGIVPGMFGRLRIAQAPEKTLVVPASAVIRAGQLAFVDVAEHGRLVRRAVQLGRMIGDRYEVFSGLAEGERVALRSAPPAGGDAR